jgi:hypothetical protein
MTDYAELERLAREATPGPWVLDGGYVRVLGVIQVGCAKEADAAYIAAASPDVILALLAERRALRKLYDAARALNNVASWSALGRPETQAFQLALRDAILILQAEPAQEGAPR